MADESLDEILSTPSAATPEATTETTTEQSTTSTEGAVRDEHGRFAPKAPAAATATNETAATATTEPETGGTVPQQALHETRQQLKEQRERADRLEQALLARAQPATPAAPAEPPKAPDFWEDPNAFVNHALTPIQEQFRRQTEVMSRRFALKEHGQETVDSAYTAMGEALKSDPNVRPIYQRIMASQDPYEDLVQWHKQETNKQRIGSDPDAFVQSELEKMLADPAKKAELLARLTGTAAPAPAAQGSTPTNITRLPPSLSRLPGGNATPAEGEQSLEAIIRAGRR